MTVQEAKETLEALFSDSTGEEYPYTDKFGQAVHAAIQALEEVEQYRALGTVEELKEAREKQVAKKPIPNCSFFECPSCESFDIETFNDSGGSTKNKFCPDCGQRIDWSEEE